MAYHGLSSNRSGASGHKGTGPYTPFLHHISGMFAESISAPVTAGNVAGSVPSSVRDTLFRLP